MNGLILPFRGLLDFLSDKSHYLALEVVRELRCHYVEDLVFQSVCLALPLILSGPCLPRDLAIVILDKLLFEMLNLESEFTIN